MSKKMVFKSSIEDEKIKIRAMRAVAGCGVDSIEVNMEEGKLTAVGDVDPVYLAKKLRKLGYRAELLSVGPAKEEKKDPEKEKEEAEKEAPSRFVYFGNPSGYGYPAYTVVSDEYHGGCTIV